MLFLLCITSVTLMSFYADKYSKKFCLFLCALILSILCGLRGIGTGVDTFNYVNYMSTIRKAGILYGSDIGFNILSYIISSVCPIRVCVLPIPRCLCNSHRCHHAQHHQHNQYLLHPAYLHPARARPSVLPRTASKDF